MSIEHLFVFEQSAPRPPRAAAKCDGKPKGGCAHAVGTYRDAHEVHYSRRVFYLFCVASVLRLALPSSYLPPARRAQQVNCIKCAHEREARPLVLTTQIARETLVQYKFNKANDVPGSNVPYVR